MSGLQVADLFAGLRLQTDVRSFELGDKLITRIKQGVVGLLAFKSIRWAQSQIDQTVELGSSIADLSQKIGVPAEALQELGYAAQLSGGSMESLGNSLGKLAKLASEAKKGGKEAASTFHDMGVKVTEADGSLRPAEDLLGDIADHIASLPDGTEKTALAMRAFGRSGKDLIPLLNEGSEGINKMRADFVALGGEMDGESVDALEKFGDSMDTVHVAMTGVRNQLVIGILPYLKEMVEGFIEWVKVNRQVIRQHVENALKVLVPIMKIVVKLAGALLVILDATFTFLSHWGQMLVEMWEQQKLGISAMIALMLAFKSASISAAIASAAAWAVPLAAIAAILLIAEDLWVWQKGGDSLLGRIHKGLVDLFVKAIEFWVAAFKEFFSWLDEKIDALSLRIRSVLPEFLGGLSEDEKTNFRGGARTAAELSRPVEHGAAAADEFFSPGSDVRQLEREAADREHQRVANESRRSVASIPINAPITINGTGAVDPNELARLLQVKLEGIIRTAHAHATAGK